MLGPELVMASFKKIKRFRQKVIEEGPWLSKIDLLGNGVCFNFGFVEITSTGWPLSLMCWVLLILNSVKTPQPKGSGL